MPIEKMMKRLMPATWTFQSQLMINQIKERMEMMM